MQVLEIECHNLKCNCVCTIGQTQHFNIIFISELQLNKSFTCDNCEELILMVDKELLNKVN